MGDVEIIEGEGRVGSFLISQGLDREHEMVKKLIDQYKEKFEYFSTLKVGKLRSTGGRAANEYLLDEDQFMFLGTLLRNNEKVVEFKFRIIKQFKKCREELQSLRAHKQEQPYQVTRDAGKIVRRQTTDMMQKFVEYASEQGSKNADKYYISISKMLNDLLFTVEGKHKNLRELLTLQQLMTISSAEQIIDKGLSVGMANKKFYKDIFQEVKGKVQIFVELHGKSSVISEQLLIK